MADQLSLFDLNADYYDKLDSNIDFNKLNFKVHASLIYKLGESLIADEITALSELMKNSYDADASFCNLIIEPNYVDENGHKGKIEISDNGIGMDIPTIINGWLTISNSPKKKMKKENITTPKFSRIPLGEKGLGRLSVQKLGRKAEIITKTKNSDIENSLTIPWEEFLKNTTLDKINLSCRQRKIESDKSYTKIVITNLVNVDFWNKEEVRKDLEKTINQIISPFRFANNNFVISAKIGGSKIDVSNSMFNDILKTARSNYTFSVNKNAVTLTINYKIDFFKKRNIYKGMPNFDFSRDYFLEMLEDAKKTFPSIDYVSNGNEVYNIKFNIPLEDYSILKRNENGLLYYPGDFEGSIYDFSYDKNYISEMIVQNDFLYALQENEYKEYIRNNKGIKVIRDGFVVQGYGDGNVDWLNISSLATTSGRYSNLRNENVIGYIRLSGEKNQVLKETTSREGFISDDFYQNFYSIIREIIVKRINKTNENLTDIFKQYFSSVLVKEDQSLEYPIEKIKSVSSKAKDISQDISNYVLKNNTKISSMINEAKHDLAQVSFVPDNTVSKYQQIIEEQALMINEMNKEFNAYLSEVDDIKKNIAAVEENIDNYNRRIGDVFELAGLGISVEMFTHELYTTINNVNEKIISTGCITEELKYISNSMNSLRKQISYFHPGLKYVRMRKEKISLSTIVYNHIEFYKAKADSKGICFNIDDRSDNVNIVANIGLINQVFDNLFSNSFYWLLYSRDTVKKIDKCEYNIKVNKNGTIDVWDNGIGISKSVENDIFNPFVSCKENGRGLGLFICKNNLENNNASIRLLRERNIYGNLYKFHIDLVNLVETEV